MIMNIERSLPRQNSRDIKCERWGPKRLLGAAFPLRIFFLHPFLVQAICLELGLGLLPRGAGTRVHTSSGSRVTVALSVLR